MIALAWIFVLIMALHHRGHAISGSQPMRFEGFDFLLVLVMWWGMAIAMMLPTALPPLQVLEQLTGAAQRKGERAGKPAAYALGFIAVWFGFGVLASILQYILHNGALLSPAGESTSAEFSACLFLLAGLYQWTPLKRACVLKCRAPMTFFLTFWEEGNSGYWRMGLRMGKFCLGCCWAMMLLMFALGMMNLLWMGFLTIYMYVEKNWVRRPWIDRASGLVLVFTGVLMLVLARLG